MATETEPHGLHGVVDRVIHLLDGPQDPPLPTRPAPTAAEAARAFVELTLVTLGLNLLALAIGDAAGASMTVDVGVTIASVGMVSIIVATTVALAAAVLLWTIVGHHVSAFAYLWVPLGWGVGLLSLGGVLGASDLGTGITLASMHVMTTAVGTLWLPRRLPR